MNKLVSSIFYSLYTENQKTNFVFSPASYLEAVNNLALCLKGRNLEEVLAALEVSEKDLAEYVEAYRKGLDLETYNCLLYWSLLDDGLLDPSWRMWVQKIIQKAYIDFTKDGTEAAAATAIMIAVSGCFIGLPQRFKDVVADKPFLYVLADRNKPLEPLFLGIVNQV